MAKGAAGGETLIPRFLDPGWCRFEPAVCRRVAFVKHEPVGHPHTGCELLRIVAVRWFDTLTWNEPNDDLQRVRNSGIRSIEIVRCNFAFEWNGNARWPQ